MQTQSDPIIARASAAGRAGIGIVRVSGKKEPILALIQRLFPHKEIKPRYAHLVCIKDGKDDLIDQAIAIYFEAPRSYTGEAVLEIQSHGGTMVVARVMQRLLELGTDFGLRQARPGEFTERAFLNGRMDLAQAEAVADLIDAGSEASARAAARSMQGVFSAKVKEVNNVLIELRGFVEATLDFPEDEVDFIQKGKIHEGVAALLAKLEALSREAMRGKVLREGLCVVLVGAPNVGKSSLMNALAGEDVAIVTDVAGTTRDKIEYDITVDGLTVKLIDTAGLHRTTDTVESIGIERALQTVTNADVVVCLKDATRLDDKEDETALELVREHLREGVQFLTVVNKIDLNEKIVKNQSSIYISAKTKAGIEDLIVALKTIAGVTDTSEGEFMARTRHLQCLENAKGHLIVVLENLESMNLDIAAEELRLAGLELGEIVGQTLPDDLLGRIFSTFCIGK